MRRFRCRVCGEDTGTSDSHLCGRCAGLRDTRVSTPLGFGIVDSLRPTGEVVVCLDTGVYRQFASSEVTPQPALQPALQPVPTREPDRTSWCPPLPDDMLIEQIWLMHRRALVRRSLGAAAYAAPTR